MDESLGPYMNEDGDWWVPTTVTQAEAQSMIEGCIDTGYSEIKFQGVEVVPVHDHELDIWIDERCSEAGCRREVECWHFVEDDKAYVIDEDEFRCKCGHFVEEHSVEGGCAGCDAGGFDLAVIEHPYETDDE